MTTLTIAGRNALIAVIALLLGVASMSAVLRAGDEGDDQQSAQSGPSTSAPSTTVTTTSPSTTTTTTGTTPAPSGTAAPTTAPAPPTTPPPTVLGSGLADDGAGEVAMGDQIPDTGIESTLAPGVTLIGAGVGLRVLLRRRAGG